MQRTLVGFEASYRRHLAAEQRRAVLDALAQSFDDESTVGQIVDAAAALGYVGLGDLSLADLADALLTDARAGQGAASTDDEDDSDESDDDADESDDDADGSDDEDADDEEAEEPAPAKGRGRAVAKPVAKAVAKPVTKAAPPAKAAAKPAGKGGKPPKISLDDRMSLAEAADVLLPLVRALGQATMQQLEGSTAGAGRRKLRFHIGQLVRNGHLERHGMGRGTYYTVA